MSLENSSHTSATHEKDRGINLTLVMLIGVVGAFLIGITWYANQQKKQQTSVVAGVPAGADAAAAAQTPGAAGDPVLVTVNGKQIRQSDVGLAINALPPETRQQLSDPRGQMALIEQLIQMEVLAQEGRRMNVDDDPAVKRKLDAASSNVVANATLAKLSDQSAAGDLQQLYNENQKEFQSVRIKQILIAPEGSQVKPRSGKALSVDAARAKTAALAARIQGGEAFEKVAAAESDDVQTAKNGGEMGEMGRGFAPPEVEAVLFNMKPGQVSGPVQTKFGFHLFKMIENKTRSFEEVKPLLAREGGVLRARKKLDQLIAAAKVDWNPTFFGAQKKKG